jgi:iron-chelate-transporting ATPase
MNPTLPAQQANDYEAAGFTVDGVGLDIGGAAILAEVGLSFPKGEFVALVGHNGSGKSTLLRIMARQQRFASGRVLYDGRDVNSFDERVFARKIAYLPQDVTAGTDMTVRELVACGRYPWHGPFGRFSETDTRKVEDALAATHLDAMAGRLVGTLSGGERQRAWIAMLIAQDSECLLLDEPTAALDVAHQIEILGLVRNLCRQRGVGVVVVLHDINLAARFCDRIHALAHGRVVASGNPKEIVSSEPLRRIYGIDMGVIPHPSLDIPLAYVA